MEMASGIRDTSKSGEVVEFVNDFQIVRICHALGTRVEPRNGHDKTVNKRNYPLSRESGVGGGGFATKRLRERRRR